MEIFKRLEKAKLTKKDISNISTYKSKNYSSIYDELWEWDIYSLVKSVRKDNWDSKLNFTPANPNTYKSLVINKPREWSPASSLIKAKPQPTTFKSVVDKMIWIKTNDKKLNEKAKNALSFVSNLAWDKITKEAEENIKKYIDYNVPNISWAQFMREVNDEVAKTTARKLWWALDVTTKVAYKWIDYAKYWKDLVVTYWGTTLHNVAKKALYTWAWEEYNLKENIKKDLKKEEILLADRKLKRQLFLWVRDWVWLNLNSLEENRKILVSQLTWDKKLEAEKYLEDNKWNIMAADVAAWVITWLWTWWAAKSLIKKVPSTYRATKAWLEAFDEILNPSLNKLSAIWAYLWLSAVSHYESTGEYLFDDDKTTEQWAAAWALWLVLKAIWVSYNTSSDILKQPEVQDWLKSFFDKYARKSWAIANIVDNTVWTWINWTPRVYSKADKKKLYNVLSELNEQQYLKNPDKFKDLPEAQDMIDLWGIEFKDVKWFTPKTENIKILREYWILWKDWLFTEEWVKIIKEFKLPFLGKWVHIPKIKDKIIVPAKEVTIKEKTIDDGAIKWINSDISRVKEDATITKIKSIWMYDDTKTPFKNKLDYYTDTILWKMFNKTAERFSRLYWKNADEVLEKIKHNPSMWKLSEINKSMNNIVDELWDDVDKFQKYIFAKSRAAKITNYRDATGEELKTAIWWRAVDENFFLSAIDDIESWVYWVKFKELADKYKKINKKVVNYLVESWVYSRAQWDRYLSLNPYYSKDELDLAWDKFMNKYWWINTVKTDKTLVWWTEEFDYKENSIETMYSMFASKIIAAWKNKLYKEALDIAEKYWTGNNITIRRVPEKWLIHKWEELMEVMINWEKVNIAVNKAYKDALDYINPIAWSFTKIASIWTNTLRWWTTWPWAIWHPIYMVLPDTVNSIIYAKSQWIDTTKYVWTLWDSWTSWWFSKSKSPYLKELLNSIASDTGADFSYIKATSVEWVMWWDLSLNRWIFRWIQDKYNNKVTRGATKTVDWLYDFWHNMEMKAARLPLIKAWLDKAWIDEKTIEKIVREADTLWISAAEHAKSFWINVNKIWWVARDFFNYNDTSNTLRKYATFFPYITIAPASTMQMVRLMKSDPKAATAIMATSLTFAQILYQFNYWWEKWDELRWQWQHLSHQSWFYLWDWHLFRIKNIPSIEWIYPIVVEFNELYWPQTDKFELNKALAKMIKDTTYFWDISTGDFIWTLKDTAINLIPTQAKTLAEATFNYNSFYDAPIISELTENEDFPVYNYSSWTWEWFKRFTMRLADITGWEKNSDWVMEWWVQISPAKLEHLLAPVNPMEKRTADFLMKLYKTSWDTITKIEQWKVEELNLSEVSKLFVKSYKLYEWNPAEDIIWKEDSVDKAIKSQIKDVIKNWTKEERIAIAEKYWDEYKDYIVTKLKERQIVNKYWFKMYSISQMPADKIYLTLKSLEADDKKALLEMLNNTLSEDKMNKLMKIAREQKKNP